MGRADGREKEEGVLEKAKSQKRAEETGSREEVVQLPVDRRKYRSEDIGTMMAVQTDEK